MVGIHAALRPGRRAPIPWHRFVDGGRSDLASPTPRISSSMSPGMLTGSGSPSRRTTLKTRLLIGRENSLFHKKIYLGVDSAASLTKSAR